MSSSTKGIANACFLSSAPLIHFPCNSSEINFVIHVKPPCKDYKFLTNILSENYIKQSLDVEVVFIIIIGVGSPCA